MDGEYGEMVYCMNSQSNTSDINTVRAQHSGNVNTLKATPDLSECT